MAYKQNAGRDNLTNPNISALTKPGDFSKALYESSRNVQNTLNADQSSGVLANPKLSTFRPRGTEAYKTGLLSPNKNISEFPGGVPASFSKGKGKTPYLNSRFILNAPQKNNIVNTMEEQQSIDVRTSIGGKAPDVEQYNRVRQKNAYDQYDQAKNRNNGGTTSGVKYNSMQDMRSAYNDIISGQTTSRENMVTNSKPLSTAWNANTSIAEEKAAFAADQKPGNMGFSQSSLTKAQQDKAQEDMIAKKRYNPHHTQVRAAEKAAKRSSKVAETLEQAFKTGSESRLNKAINTAKANSRTDEYFGRAGNEAYFPKESGKPKTRKNQVSYQHAEMIKNYEKASNAASKRQDTSDKLKFIAQDFAMDKASGKFSLNSNNSSNSNINTNNLFKNSRLTTDITDGKKKRFKF